MKKLLLILAVGGLGSPAFADITHRMQSSVSLTTAAAATQVERVGSTYSISGSGIDTVGRSMVLLEPMTLLHMELEV